MYPPKTVIEIARKAAGLSQAQLAMKAGTAQSSVSEYESRRKSPTLEVVERLLEAADAELAIKPIIDFDVRQDAEIGRYVVPERLWSCRCRTASARSRSWDTSPSPADRSCGTCRTRPSASTTTSG